MGSLVNCGGSGSNIKVKAFSIIHFSYKHTACKGKSETLNKI